MKAKYLEKNNLNVHNLQKNHKEFIKTINWYKKFRKIFRSQKQNGLTGEVHKIPLSVDDDKRIQSIDSVETYAYATKKHLVCKKGETKCDIIKNNTKMINFDDVKKQNIKKHNPSWLQIPDHSNLWFRILKNKFIV